MSALAELLRRLTGLDVAGTDLVEPRWLLLAPVVVGAFVAAWAASRRSVLFAAPGMLGDVARPTWRTRLRVLPVVVVALGLTAVCVALARPARTVVEEATVDGTDIVLCIDVSSSMNTVDSGEGARTRLDAARDAAERFARARVGDRLALVTFARWPELRCPPTLDQDAFAAMLRDVSAVEAESEADATGIGAALARAAALVEESRSGEGGAPETGVVVLLTDGEENVADELSPDAISPSEAAELCARFDVRVHVVLASGDAADTATAESVAGRTGGRAFAANDAAGLSAVYDAVDALESRAFAAPTTRLVDRYPPFLALGLVLLALGWGLLHGPWGSEA